MDKLAMDGVRLERHYVCELAIVGHYSGPVVLMVS